MHKKISVGNSEGKEPLGRPRLRWKNIIKMYLREVGWEDVDWMHLTHDGTIGGLLRTR
jgi:hypothetical protein